LGRLLGRGVRTFKLGQGFRIRVGLKRGRAESIKARRPRAKMSRPRVKMRARPRAK
jgi:hypothetical protein